MSVPPGSAVDLVLSRGPAPIPVPDLTGLPAIIAANTLHAVGLSEGAITFAFDETVKPGQVITQSPAPGTLVAPGTAVSVTLASLTPDLFNVDATIISQYANSPTLLRIIHNMEEYIDPRVNMLNFYNAIWNVDTAQGFGLDIWGKIVGVSRLLKIPSNSQTLGFANSDVPPDWAPFNVGTWFTGQNAGQSFLLPDDVFRTLILVKALANIVATTAASINQLLRNLFPGRGVCYVLDNGGMSMTFFFEFDISSAEYAILTQSGVLPHPAGVKFNVVVLPAGVFGFEEMGGTIEPFDQGTFYQPPS